MATNKITLAQIDAKIATFSTNRKALQTLAHDIAMMILRHAAPKEVSPDCVGSGDCTRALSLMEQMPKSWAAQMDNFFRLYSPIIVVTKNKKCGFNPDYKKLTAEEKLLVWKLDLAAQNPFYELEEPEAQSKVLDFEALVKMVEGMAKRLEKQAEEGKVAEEDIPSALALVTQLKGLKIKRVKPAPANTNEAPASVPAAATA